MADAREIIRTITGVEPTHQQVQRLMAIGSATDIPSTDPMYPVMVMMDAEYSAFSKLPDRIREAYSAGEHAAEQAAHRVAAEAAALVSARIGEQVDGAAIMKKVMRLAALSATIVIAAGVAAATMSGWLITTRLVVAAAPAVEQIAASASEMTKAVQSLAAPTIYTATLVGARLRTSDEINEIRKLVTKQDQCFALAAAVSTGKQPGQAWGLYPECGSAPSYQAYTTLLRFGPAQSGR